LRFGIVDFGLALVNHPHRSTDLHVPLVKSSANRADSRKRNPTERVKWKPIVTSANL
jgi:hypothetical protein